MEYENMTALIAQCSARHQIYTTDNMILGLQYTCIRRRRLRRSSEPGFLELRYQLVHILHLRDRGSVSSPRTRCTCTADTDLASADAFWWFCHLERLKDRCEVYTEIHRRQFLDGFLLGLHDVG